MEAEFGEKLHNLHGPVMTMGKKSLEWDLNLKSMGKKSMEWDLNDWGWDGDLFVAAPLNSVPSDCISRQLYPVGSNVPVNNGASTSFSDEVILGNVREKRDLEKRRRTVEVEHELVSEEARSLNLKLGGQVYPVTEKEVDNCEGKSGKKTKVCGAPSSCVVCQVEDCKADLSNAKDYHRRHKVCDVHSKATRALVGNVMQRFCQQCSRFHVLQEFDEGKRSCRRRLAGHNKRRRKTHPENAVNAATLNDQQGSNYLLISLLRILSNIHTNSASDQMKDQDLLSHLLRNLANIAGTTNERNPGGMLPVSQDLQNVLTSLRTAVKDPTMPAGSGLTVPASDWAQKRNVMDNVQGGDTGNASTSRQSSLLFSKKASNSIKEDALDTAVGKTKLNNIDLNSVYDGSQDCSEDLPDTVSPESLSVGPLWLHKDSQRSSPPQTSTNSGSTLSQSLSASSGEAQSRTDRIVFKLFGKDPSDLPLLLRKQILDWLSSSPTDIESYIRPGCIILTIYLCMDKSSWEEMYCDLASSLTRLLDSSNDSFWRTGWIYSRVGQCVTFVFNGQVVLETPLPLKDHRNCGISSIKPVAVSVSEDVKFVVKGFNLSRSASRLLCALEGKYLVQQNCADMTGGADSYIQNDEIQSLSFSCVIPDTVGRGFIEVEDHGLSSSFFPFIVAEKDVCFEICTLESIIEVAEALEARNQALDFIHEIGWLLHKSRLKSRLESDDVDLFSFRRFRWLIEFAIDHNWCAVVKKLLNILFDGIVDAGQHNSILLALLDICLLHRAVQRNCRPMVEFLLEYHPGGASDKTGPEHKQLDEGNYLFRPDSMGPGGWTPLHMAASLVSCEDVLDALTNDPGSVGVEAWKNARDSTGLTPHDYACFSGHYSHINLVQRKLDKKSGKGQVIVDIPAALLDGSIKQKIGNPRMLSKWAAFQTEKNCRQCDQKLAYGRLRGSLRIYRPTMLSMVAIAAVCVCAALLFKSSPEVLCSFRPFRWELLKFGSQ
ncbi:hypothetical protein BUALT_Bualt12G0106200 [Buddleja alternifolia]|uniref:SBP-type domain-containing protein n=1 Tax=Buddleja alternifolia TaxID=168488 RepID=A0AAV6WY86_9LAMI|nr:hypothetical protein BUALT_Bualt12G0106200 [Buddleja alternifolia]